MEKLRDREEYRNNKDKSWNKFGKQKGGSNRPQFQKKKWQASSSASAHEQRNKGEHHGQNSQNFIAGPTQSLVSVAKGGSWDSVCSNCGINYPGKCCE